MAALSRIVVTLLHVHAPSIIVSHKSRIKAHAYSIVYTCTCISAYKYMYILYVHRTYILVG